MSNEALPFLKVSTKWIGLEIISESDVVLTFKGYAPVLCVREIETGIKYRLYISAKSLAAPLEELRKDNGGTFKGTQIHVRKEGRDQMAKYEVDTSNSFQKKLKSPQDMKKKLEEVLLN